MRLFAVIVFGLLVLAGCGGNVSALPEEFTRERADGKIPVKTELIRQQVQKEIDGMPEGEAKVWRWSMIEQDYHSCRLSSANSSSDKVEKVFADCMASNGYVYMYRLDAEQLHNDIEFEESKRYDEEQKIAKQKAEQVRKQKVLDHALLMAVRSGDMEKELELVAEGANPDIAEQERRRIFDEKQQTQPVVKQPIKINDSNLNLALINAGKEGNLGLVQQFLIDGANPNAVDKNNNTTLIWAVFNGYNEIASILINAGANVNIANKKGNTALIWAVFNGYNDLATALINADANVNMANKKGNTALIWAAFKGYTKMVRVLINAGANVNIINKNGNSALTLSTIKKHDEIVQILSETSNSLN